MFDGAKAHWLESDVNPDYFLAITFFDCHIFAVFEVLSSMPVTDLSRRRFLTHTTCGAVCSAFIPNLAYAAFPDKVRTITMNNLHTGEILNSCYFDGKHYVESEAA